MVHLLSQGQVLTKLLMSLHHGLVVVQGGPGCASLYGSLYINGPQRVCPEYFSSFTATIAARVCVPSYEHMLLQVTPELSLRPNKGSWNLRYGVLYIDQPIGTGFSTAGGTSR